VLTRTTNKLKYDFLFLRLLLSFAPLGSFRRSRLYSTSPAPLHLLNLLFNNQFRIFNELAVQIQNFLGIISLINLSQYFLSDLQSYFATTVAVLIENDLVAFSGGGRLVLEGRGPIVFQKGE
jgi:hypothetical protein